MSSAARTKRIPWPAIERATTAAVYTVRDDLTGLSIVVGGSGPAVARVLGARNIVQFDYEVVEAEYLDARQPLWPETIPSDLHKYAFVAVVPAARLASVDVVEIIAGAYTRGTTSKRQYLWQPAAIQPLVLLTEREARAALASPWLASARRDHVVASGRAIRALPE